MYGVQLAMSPPVYDSAGLRLLLQSKLNGKAARFRDIHLKAMLACGLNSEAKLSSAGWSKLYDQAALPLALVEALLQAYNADALHNSGTPEDGCHYGIWHRSGCCPCCSCLAMCRQFLSPRIDLLVHVLADSPMKQPLTAYLISGIIAFGH